ncbi:MAG: methionine biosynthesis protein MetW [Pseudomonadota bacterium]|nr:methionine biosynthesis protein MetW [Pseudomonadota bacterium]
MESILSLSSVAISWIDQEENYGRHVVRSFLVRCAPYGHVLDVGAGCGNDLAIARDVCPEAVCHAIECFPRNAAALENQGFPVNSLNLERDRFPFEDACLDVIIANQILEHTKELFWILHEMSRCLKVGGRLLIGVPNVAAFHNRILLLFGRHPSQAKSCSAHVRCFSRNDFLDFLGRTFPGGYDLEAFAGSNFYPFPKCIARPLAAFLPSMAQSIFFLLRKKTGYTGSIVDYPRKYPLETNFWLG